MHFAYIHTPSVRRFVTSKPCIHTSAKQCKSCQSCLSLYKIRFSSIHSFSRNIKVSLQLLNQRPLIIADVSPVEFLQGIDALP